MDVVRTLLDRRADNAAGVAVVLGVQRAVDQRELIDGVEVRGIDEGVERDVVGVCAVDEEVDCCVWPPLMEDVPKRSLEA